MYIRNTARGYIRRLFMKKKFVKEKAYLTPLEVAEKLMVSPVTVRQWAAKGQLKAHTTLGGHRRFMRDEVDRFAREHGLASQDNDDQKIRILIVDDDEHLARYLVELFTGLNEDVVVETAGDGFEAGRKTLRFRPHVMLLDLMMPGMDGFELCRVLKEDPETRTIRVIAMTGYPTQENVDLVLAAGAEECLAKPIETETLLAAVGLS